MSIIGVEWNQGTDTWSRIDVAGDPLSPPTFNSEAPWGDIVRCTLNADGSENEVSANGKGSDISLDGSTGRVMVRIPKFWIKSDSPGANRYRWWISAAAYSGFEVHPAFYQRGNTGAPADYIYVGAYEAGSNNTVLRSQTGDTVKASQNIGAFRTQAEAIDSVRWGITGTWARSAYMLLYYIEYADADSQTTIGAGITGVGAISVTGDDGIDANLATNGTGTGTGIDDETPIAYRGIENLWGNVAQFIDGYEAVDAEYRIIKRDGSGTFRNPLQAGDYEASTAAPITSNGSIKNIIYEDLLSLQFIASDTTGSSSTYLHDWQYGHDTGEVNILLVSGYWGRGIRAGLAFLFVSTVVSYTSTTLGGRLEFIPEALAVTPQAVGGGSIAIASTLNLKSMISVGAGSVTIAGTLGRVIKLAVGNGSIAISGALAAALTFFQNVGSGSITITGTLGRLVKIGVGSGSVAIAGALGSILTFFQSVGSGSIAIAGSLGRNIFLSVGGGSIAIAGTLGRLIKLTVGDGSIAISGALSSVLTFFQTVGSGAVSIAGSLTTSLITLIQQAVGGGSVAISGTLGRLIKITVGSGAIAIAGSLLRRTFFKSHFQPELYVSPPPKEIYFVDIEDKITFKD